MNLAEIRSLAAQRLDEDPAFLISGSWTQAEYTAAINEGQMLLVLLTLCLETTVTFNLAANTWAYDPFAQIEDWIVPLRVRAAGAKLRTVRIEDLDAYDSGWRLTTGPAPLRYGTLGWSILYFYPQPKVAGVVAQVTYANSPAVLALDADTPQVPEQHHPALVAYCVYHLRQKLGGLELQKGLEFFKEFIESAKQLGSYTRSRAIGQRYDMVPIEISRLDLSRLLRLRKDLLPVKAVEAPLAD